MALEPAVRAGAAPVPVLVITASPPSLLDALREVVAHADLLYFLAWRDVKLRYRQTALGVAWVVLQPLVTLALLSGVFGRLAGLPSDGVPYPLFAYTGLLPWTFCSTAVSSSSASLVGSANLITKVYFPRVIIPAAAVAGGLIDFAIGLLLLAAMLAGYGVVPGWSGLSLAALLPLTVLLALALGMFTAALNVAYRDVRYVLPFLIQTWMFATPVIYPTSLVPEAWRWTLWLNPLTGIIDAYRAALLGSPFSPGALAVSVVTVVALAAGSLYWFQRRERRFADLI